jgi:N-succinyldiaminopimelate aminotransferase
MVAGGIATLGLAMPSREPNLPVRLQGLGPSIFAEMSALAEQTGAINLGQGFPDTDGPAVVLDAAVAAIRDGQNQYPPGLGIPALRDAIAEHQRRFWGLEFDPSSEILVTAGATEAITAAVLGLCEPGDEVLTFEPTFDSYPAAVALAGASLRVVTLDAPDYALDVDALAAAVTARTRMLLLNSPHNPTGKVFSVAELQAIAGLCVERDLIAVTDEVYEHLVYDGTHVPLASFPGMRDRTVTVSSAGKTFSVTGWKIGWACAPAALLDAVRTVKQHLTYVNGAPFQPAVAAGLALGDDYFAGVRDSLRAKRDLLCDGLVAAGLDVFRPAATYFATADIRSIGEEDGLAFCRALPERCGVVAIPSGVFFQDPARGRHLVRFTFCKRDEVLHDAVVRLKQLR